MDRLFLLNVTSFLAILTAQLACENPALGAVPDVPNSPSPNPFPWSWNETFTNTDSRPATDWDIELGFSDTGPSTIDGAKFGAFSTVTKTQTGGFTGRYRFHGGTAAPGSQHHFGMSGTGGMPHAFSQSWTYDTNPGEVFLPNMWPTFDLDQGDFRAVFTNVVGGGSTGPVDATDWKYWLKPNPLPLEDLDVSLSPEGSVSLGELAGTYAPGQTAEINLSNVDPTQSVIIAARTQFTNPTPLLQSSSVGLIWFQIDLRSLAIPEPCTWTLAGLGFIAVGFVRRRR